MIFVKILVASYKNTRKILYFKIYKENGLLFLEEYGRKFWSALVWAVSYTTKAFERWSDRVPFKVPLNREFSREGFSYFRLRNQLGWRSKHYCITAFWVYEQIWKEHGQYHLVILAFQKFFQSDIVRRFEGTPKKSLLRRRCSLLTRYVED